MSKPPPKPGAIPPKPGVQVPPPTRTAPASRGAPAAPSSIPEGASSTVGFYSTASKVAAASAKGAAPIESMFSGLSGFSPVPATHQLSLRPPSRQESTISMGSSGRTTPRPTTPLVAPAAPPPPRPYNTSNGPSRRSVVVTVEASTLVDLLPLGPQLSWFIDNFQSSLLVESFRLAYGGLCLTTTSVPSPSDLSRLETFTRTLVPEGSSV